MSQNKPVDLRENLSALVDGEAADWDVRKTLQRVADDNSLRDDWATFQKIGAVLRNEPAAGVDISSAVMATLDEESAPSKLGYFKKTIMQTAVAASVATVALIGIQQYQVAEQGGGTSSPVAEAGSLQQAPSLAQPPAGFEFQPVTRAVSSSTSEPSMTQGTSVQIPVDRERMKSHLDTLVRKHSEHSVYSSQDVIPMVRVPVPSEAE